MQGRSAQTGFTLIELMVSLTIGLFIILGVLVVYVGGIRSYSVNDALSRVQESGRFAMEFLSRDIRQAGFQAGCTTVNNLLDETDDEYSELLHFFAGGISGWNNDAGAFADDLVGYQPGTDVLLLKNAANLTGVTASGNTPANANTIQITAASGIPRGTIILVADSIGCDLFQKANNANAQSLTRGAGGGGGFVPGNKNPGTNDFSHQYDDEMQIFQFDSMLYYVGTGTGGGPALRRARLQSDGKLGGDVELVSNIQSMQVEYGVDSDNDNNVNSYETADAIGNWDQVLSARLSLLVSDETDNVLEVAADALPAPFQAVDTSDRRLRRVFTSTVALRNKLP
ncbi:PilW family protein [Marinobacterium mangrovicola]|uniref:Type IV pilus assembly protein PilW n=1 Tax=Marinobacterium mangrovicola TaxID=1476959 RepID=A0A4R1GDL0_9GAMM|nr:PilW family protein [Marinobacterium mangrovicola]TCK05938.1 type IV pilus assembly protein PilW [Marinobacterium mangrovicola]